MLPKDPFLLVSYVNTKLRDDYENLESLADAEGVSVSDITDALKKIDYVYNKSTNQFS